MVFDVLYTIYSETICSVANKYVNLLLKLEAPAQHNPVGQNSPKNPPHNAPHEPIKADVTKIASNMSARLNQDCRTFFESMNEIITYFFKKKLHLSRI